MTTSDLSIAIDEDASGSGSGLGNWFQAYHRAQADVRRMSLAEKQSVTLGVSPSPNGCVGVSGAAESVGFPGLCLQDGPTGVRGADFVTAFPAEMHIGASWNQDLAYEIAEHMGMEFRKKGVNVALGPVAGPLGELLRMERMSKAKT